MFFTAICLFTLHIASAQSTNSSNTDSQTTGQSPGNDATKQADNTGSAVSKNAEITRAAGQIGTVQPATDTKNNNNTSPSTSGNNRSAGNISTERSSVSDPTGTGTGQNTGR